MSGIIPTLAVVLPCPPQHHQVPVESSGFTRTLFPQAFVVPRPEQATRTSPVWHRVYHTKLHASCLVVIIKDGFMVRIIEVLFPVFRGPIIPIGTLLRKSLCHVPVQEALLLQPRAYSRSLLSSI
jgi:hypothetical protein